MNLVAHYFHQSIIVYLILSIPCGLIMFKCDSLLGMIEEDPESVKACHELLLILLPGVFFDCLIDMHVIYFSALQKATVPMMLQMCAVPTHFCLSCYLVYHTELGIYGTAISLDVAMGLAFFGLLAWQYIFSTDEVVVSTRVMPNFRKMTQGLKSFLSLTGSGLFIRFAEEWAYYFLVIIAGLISFNCQEITVITMSFGDLLFQLPIATSLATSTLVGTALGHKDLPLVEQTAKFTL